MKNIKKKRLTPKNRAILTIENLKLLYPEAICSLNYSTPYELLFATRLSAQCTDARVNIVTKELFSKYKTLDELANASLDDLEKIIKSCGLFKTKAKDIFFSSKILLEQFNGKVPDNMDDLLKLPGIGRKTANLVLGDIYNKPAIVTDTHCIRISNRIGLTSETVPLKVEMALKNILPENESNDLCHRFVLFGRDTCIARNPKCEICKLNYFCKYFNK